MDVDNVDMIFGDENVGDNAFDDVDVGGAPQSHNDDLDDKSYDDGCGYNDVTSTTTIFWLRRR